jgi:hypothetical protein
MDSFSAAGGQPGCGPVGLSFSRRLISWFGFGLVAGVKDAPIPELVGTSKASETPSNSL